MKGMILYEQDYINHPTAFPNYETSNISYVRASALLRDMGIKNHRFMLALHNKALVGVDPHDPNLTPAQMMAIYIECYNNYWYYIREVVRIPGSTPEVPLMFLANRGNLCLHWLYLQHIFTILTQIRQTGKSLGVAAPHIYQQQIRNRSSKIIGLTKDMSLRGSHLSLMKAMDEELPMFLRQRQEKDIANTEMINISRLDNSMVMFVPSNSPKQADRVGRGHTAATAWVDEGPYVNNLQISLGSMFAATNRARINAEQKQEMYCSVLTSTVGDLAEPEGEFYFRLTQNSAEFTERLYDCENRQHLLSVITKQCRDIQSTTGTKVPIRVYAEFNHRQLGITDEQVATWLAEAQSDGADAEKDYFNKWKMGSSKSALTKDEQDLLTSSEISPIYTSIENQTGYMVRWFIEEHVGIQLLNTQPTTWGLDTSDASGGDGIGLVGRLASSGEVIGVLNISETFLPTYSLWLYKFLKKHKKAILIPERRSSAAAIIDQLLMLFIEDGENPFRRIYNTIVQNSLEKPELYSLISKPYFNNPEIVLSNKKAFGFATSGYGVTSRSELYGRTMTNAIRLTGALTRDKQLCLQLKSLIRDDNGRVDHRAGMHDDLAIGWLLSFWMLTNAKNLDFYGIDFRSVLKDNDVNKKENDPEKLRQMHFVTTTKAQIEAYMKIYNMSSKDIFLRKRIEQELQKLHSSLPEDSRDVTGLDDLISTATDDRRFDRIKRNYC